jgi:hypothetical protein
VVDLASSLYLSPDAEKSWSRSYSDPARKAIAGILLGALNSRRRRCIVFFRASFIRFDGNRKDWRMNHENR